MITEKVDFKTITVRDVHKWLSDAIEKGRGDFQVYLLMEVSKKTIKEIADKGTGCQFEYPVQDMGTCEHDKSVVLMYEIWDGTEEDEE